MKKIKLVSTVSNQFKQLVPHSSLSLLVNSSCHSYSLLCFYDQSPNIFNVLTLHKTTAYIQFVFSSISNKILLQIRLNAEPPPCQRIISSDCQSILHQVQFIITVKYTLLYLNSFFLSVLVFFFLFE